MKFETFLLLTMNDFSVKHRLFFSICYEFFLLTRSLQQDHGGVLPDGCRNPGSPPGFHIREGGTPCHSVEHKAQQILRHGGEDHDSLL
jgi:hypothetical protein